MSQEPFNADYEWRMKKGIGCDPGRSQIESSPFGNEESNDCGENCQVDNARPYFRLNIHPGYCRELVSKEQQ